MGEGNEWAEASDETKRSCPNGAVTEGKGMGEGEGEGNECAAASANTERACPIDAVTGVASVPRSDDGDKHNGSNIKLRRR